MEELFQQIPTLLSIWVLNNTNDSSISSLTNSANYVPIYVRKHGDLPKADLFPLFDELIQKELQNIKFHRERRGKNETYRIFVLNASWLKLLKLELRSPLIGISLDQNIDNKHEILDNISRELRTPLNGIIGMTDLIVDTPLTAAQFEYVDTIRQCSYTLMGVVNDIIDFSKLCSGNVRMNPQPFSLREAVEAAYDVVSFRAIEKGIDFTFALEHDLPSFIRGDERYLRQVLVNLLGNAVKFIDPKREGKINLKVKGIKTMAPDQSNRSVHISNRHKRSSPIDSDQPQECWYELAFSITDNGIGIDEKLQPMLFQSFTQSNEKKDGTGLGLAISRLIVEMMDGKIWVESQIGVGSTFHFTIKVTENTGSDITIEDRNRQYLNGKSILLIDENENCRLSLSKLFLKWKMRPTGCSSQEEALMYIRAGVHFDAVFLDLNLAALGEKIQELTPVPLIGFSGNVNLSNRNKTIDISPIIRIPSPSSTNKGIYNPNSKEVFKYILGKPIRENKLYNICVELFSQGVNKIAHFGISQAKILLVETSTPDQRVLKSTLEKVGYLDIVVSHNGLECLAKIGDGFDLLILGDLKIPKKDGYAIAQAVYRKFSPTERPIILACTTDITKAKSKSKAKYFDDFIPKPIFSDDLQTLIEKALESRKERISKIGSKNGSKIIPSTGSNSGSKIGSKIRSSQ